MLNPRLESLLDIKGAGGRGEALLAQAERMILSERFQQYPKVAKMLRFIVEETALNGCLREIVIGMYVFKAGYDPEYDAHVRVAAIRLRKILIEYYENEGQFDPVIILLPNRGYNPIIIMRGEEELCA